jgi:phosphatidylserine/phosphatidylglycerophosphate/cardiolipin synthase-like enzyme
MAPPAARFVTSWKSASFRSSACRATWTRTPFGASTVRAVHQVRSIMRVYAGRRTCALPKNMVPKLLYTSEEVRKAISEIFRAGKHRRRIALSAYVGESAESYLPFPDKLEVVCSPTAGATSPSAIRKLISLGATVQFVDKLHMKVYWAEGVGAVVTSANLSTNAMGVGGLKEAGVLLGPEFIDIAKLLKPLQRRPAEPGLHNLDLAYREYRKRNPWTNRSRPASFADWYASPQRESWKLLVCEEYSDDTLVQDSR